ncbi:Ldh family oxidoreductase [Roseomonas sp. AR75]|uniref:Ldh family oxidoreductase n=1 Tax=Roseomonas sp. AR75 TaxID=2562311 RepID=UPI0010BFC4F0|nr:Ldh family oxidoreductase [Roseomonas sp. AR75]
MVQVRADALRGHVAALFAAAGVPQEDAALVADTLVRADLWGHSSHGVMRAPWYLDRLRTGVMTPVTAPETVVDAGAICVIDGRDGVGQVIAHRAMTDAIRRARQHGVGIISVRLSNHHGALGYFTRMAAEQGCIGFLAANGSPAMAPWGGRKQMIGTNPWSIAAPAGRHAPMMLDIANTVVARGKIFLARQKGQPIPLGWAIDAEGRPTTDPIAALSGVILPMAEHKGYAISLMMDVLSGVLSGSSVMTEVNGPYVADKRSGSGHFVMALDIARFGPLDAFERRIEGMIAEIKAVPRAEGFDEVFYPGEIEARNEARHLREGLDLPRKSLDGLLAAGARHGVAGPESW